MRALRYFFPNWNQWMSRASQPGTLGLAELRPSPAWRSLYVAALFEKDPGRVTERITQARQALVVRARELFSSNGNHVQEQNAIDEALIALCALERCTNHASTQRQQISGY